MHRRLPKIPILALTLAVLASILSACGGNSGANVLNWYINPDNGTQAKLAQSCSAKSGGKYSIKISVLPTAADQQREQLVRRLAAKDSSIDIMSLDPPFTAEFANAGYLREFSDGEKQSLTAGVLDAPIETATWQGRLVAAPFWANTQLLWYRKSVVAAMGVDPTAPDFTWDKMISTAAAAHKKIGVQGGRYEGYMVWVNALVESAGGEVLSDNDRGRDASPAIGGPAGKKAARIIRQLALSPAADPALSSALEEQARATFQGPDGAFMVNWPYVWTAFDQDIEAGSIPEDFKSDVGWAPYPRVDAGTPAKPPIGGINLAIGNFSRYKDTFALDAVRCVTSEQGQVENMVGSGNPVARGAVYDDPKIVEQFPMAALIRDSINSAGPRPVTPYYGDVSSSVQRTFHPPGSVDPDRTPARAAKLIKDVLQDRRLL